MKIAIYAIAKNEGKFVDRFVRSADDADEIIICDTGSDDDTREEALRCTEGFYRVTITPWRFDHARNASLAVVSPDADICICLDMDEVMEPGWREEIERIWTPETTRLRYGFDYSGGIQFKSEKIHSRKGYFWKYPCHEILERDPRITEVWAETDRLLISHLPDPEKPRGHYLDLLKVTVDENPGHLRPLLYYGRELVFAEQWEKAFFILAKYVNAASTEWSHERAWAYRLMARCAEVLGERQDGIYYLEKAIIAASDAREPLVDLSTLYYRLKNWELSVEYALKSLKIVAKQNVYTENADAWTWQPHDLIAIGAFNLGQIDLAREHAIKAIEYRPDDARLRQNLEFCERRMVV